jgi:hypothetical protein
VCREFQIYDRKKSASAQHFGVTVLSPGTVLECPNLHKLVKMNVKSMQRYIIQILFQVQMLDLLVNLTMSAFSQPAAVNAETIQGEAD